MCRSSGSLPVSAAELAQPRQRGLPWGSGALCSLGAETTGPMATKLASISPALGQMGSPARSSASAESLPQFTHGEVKGLRAQENFFSQQAPVMILTTTGVHGALAGGGAELITT